MEPSKIISLLILAVLSAVSAGNCPTKYARFSAQHSFCLDRNPTCFVITKGVHDNAKKVILQIHNKLRSKVATGKESRAGGLPPASNMLQMEWDQELASVAQKWAEQCIFDHDCDECRSVENFSVGQNLAYQDFPACSSNDCLKKVVQPDWKKMIKMFYEEVTLFNKNSISPFKFQEGYGHFSQVIWANSWKIGCGYVVFKNGNKIRRLYACNYGPAGNSPNAMYEAGKPRSACPSNTVKGAYAGLCKVQNLSVGPVVSESRKNNLMYCNWRDQPCKVKSEEKKWRVKQSLSGDYYTTTLKGGQKRVLQLVTPVQPKAENFCIVVVFRKSPANAADPNSSSLSLDLKIPAWNNWSTSMNLQTTARDFIPYSVNIGWNVKTDMAIAVSLPPNAPEHIFDIKEIYAYDGKCLTT